MRKSKQTQIERIQKLERVVTQLYLTFTMMQKEMKILQDKNKEQV